MVSGSGWPERLCALCSSQRVTARVGGCVLCSLLASLIEALLCIPVRQEAVPAWLPCGDPFRAEDIVVLNGTKEESEKLKERMEEKRAKAKTKKSKKSKGAETVSKPSDLKENSGSPQVDSAGKSSPQNGDESSQSAVAGPSGSSSSSKGPKSSIASAPKRTIQHMEEKSEIYKSLFTSHSSAKRTKAQTSNWVTHTPYHF